MFSLCRSVEAYRSTERGFAATDDAGVYAAAGYSVHYFEAGENRKLTYPGDEGMISTLLYAREPRPQRVGFGFDAHRLIPDRRLVLCGVEVPFPLGLRGHSDADVAVHALMDALRARRPWRYRADFPDSDRHAGADSWRYWEGACAADSRLAPFSADVTLICQRPGSRPTGKKWRRNSPLRSDCGFRGIREGHHHRGMGFTGRRGSPRRPATCPRFTTEP